MAVQKQKKTRKRVRIALLSVLLVGALATASVFWGVSAAQESVSPSDESYAPWAEPAPVTEQNELSNEPIETDETVVKESTVDFIGHTVSDLLDWEEWHETGDFSQAKFLPSAPYGENFQDSLTEYEKLVYDAYVANFITETNNSSFKVTFPEGELTFNNSSYGQNEDGIWGLQDMSVLEFVHDIVYSGSIAFIYDHPEVYWIRNYYCSIDYDPVNGGETYGVVYSVTIEPDESYSGAYSQLSTVRSGIDTAVAKIESSRASASRYHTVKAIHDYICNKVTYDQAAASGSVATAAHTAAPVFNGKNKVVCEGYSKAFKVLCDRFDIPCVLVGGNAGGGHMWNYVKMEDNCWYAVDTTWDDQSTICYTYFLIGNNSKGFSGKRFAVERTPWTLETTDGNTALYPELSDSAYVPNSKADSVTLNEESIALSSGQTFQLTAAIEPDSFAGTVKWSSSDTKIATVSSTGLVKAVNAGTAVITVTAGGKTAQCTVTVARTVVLNKSALGLTITRSKPNPTATLTVSTNGSIPNKLWLSSNESVATVTSAGKVTAVSEGTANITCTIDGVTSAACTVTVSSVVINAPEANMINGAVYVLNGQSCQLTSAGAVSWKSSNTKLAAIDSNGLVTAGSSKGTVTITATAADNTKETIKLTVVVPSNTVTVKPAAVNLYAGGSSTLKATLDKASNAPVTWTSNDEDTATVSAKGVVKGVKQGTTIITVTSFGGASTDVTVNVRTKATAIAWTETTSAVLAQSDRETGTFKVAITAPTDCNDSITWTSSSKAVASVTPASDDGTTATVKGLKKGTATITAKTGSGKKVTWKVTVVNTPAESVILTKAPTGVYAGTTAVFAAKVLPTTSNDIVLWSSSAPDVASVDANGKVKGLQPGTAIITAKTFAGEKVAESTITVRNKATAIAWTKTASVLYKGTDNATGEFTVAITAPDGCNDTITWTSSSKAVASVSPATGEGSTAAATVTGLKKGTSTITAKTGSGKKVTWKVTVVETPATDFTLKTTSAAIYVNGTTTLKATVTPKTSNEPVQWSSGDETIATVDQNGKVKGLKQGTVTITAKTRNVEKEVTVTVRTKATAINVDQTAFTVAKNGTVTLNAPTVSPAGCNDTVTWSTSSKAIATVEQQADGSAVVTGNKKGTATLTVKTGSGKAKKIKVTVTE